MSALKAFQAQEGKKYYIDTGGWFGGEVPAIFRGFTDKEAIFLVYEDGSPVECAVDLNASIRAVGSENKS